MFKILVSYIFIFSVASAQLRSEAPSRTLPVNIHGVSHARSMPLFDSNRLSVSNSFGMSMNTRGNQSISLGSFNSQLSYLVSDKVRLSSQFSLISPMSGINPYSQNSLNGAKLFYNTSINDTHFFRFFRFRSAHNKQAKSWRFFCINLCHYLE